MARSCEAVVQELLHELHRLVRDYHPDVRRTGTCMSELIDGTALFPGGAGVWRGDGAFGPLPGTFPEAPVMFVGHNFDSITACEASRLRGGEADSGFWMVLRGYLQAAGLRPEDCFFTNVLMGLKPGSSLGPMPSVAGYKEQCRTFLLRQVEIVAPVAVIALGNDADAQLKKAGLLVPHIKVKHPSAREYASPSTRDELVRRVGERISEFLSQPARST